MSLFPYVDPPAVTTESIEAQVAQIMRLADEYAIHFCRGEPECERLPLEAAVNALAAALAAKDEEIADLDAAIDAAIAQPL